MKKIKILSIIGRLSIGGASPQVIFINQYLNKDQFDTKLVIGQKNPHEGDMLYFAKERDVSFVQIPYFYNEFKFDVINDLKALYKIYKLIKKEKPHIVHTHTAKSGFLGRIAAKLAGVPIIIHTFHGHLFQGYFGWLKTNILIYGERILSFITDKILAVSEGLRKELIGYKIASPDKILSLPLGLELNIYLKNQELKGQLKRELKLLENDLLIGTIGRLVPIKGHKYFLDAALIIKKKNPRVKILIVGDGELRKELEVHAGVLGLADNVFFLGWRQDLARIYADLDVVVLSSLNEGLAVSLIEAMASSKPVVATSVGGVPDLVVDEGTGFLVKPRDAKNLAEKILWLLENRKEAKKMGEKARELVYPKYDYHEMIKNMEALYFSLYNCLRDPH